MEPALDAQRIEKWKGRKREIADDTLAVEEPLEIRVNGESIAVVMRTPGDDEELASGFLCTEGLVAGPGAIADITHRGTRAYPDKKNVVDVRLAAEASLPRDGWQRRFFAASSCGICGKQTIESIRTDAADIESNVTISIEVLYGLAEQMAKSQPVFKTTGSLHAAALFDAAGTLIDLREDVGRHNAVDKIAGRVFLDDHLPLSESILLVSGRTSFEIVQKALMLGIPIVAGISGPSSLAVELAAETNMTLIGFARGRSLNVYTGHQRVKE